ncbi:Hypothetical predicted protein [Paramuricea clavata]|uniref:DUF4440 domain-containing protein n=1 Tax=Paramuricea clavata TaxID=317549 RepID=A0A7D9EBU5_PARCT|nr:Hypothetical predicted protein [Paramuricea clavata]
MADVKAELQSRVAKLGECFVDKKPEEIINFYTDDCRVLPPGAPAVQGKEALKAFFGAMMKFVEKVDKVENNVLEIISMDGDLATSMNTDTTYDADGKIVVTNKSLTVWKKVDGLWQIHWTAWNGDKAAPTPA